ncbi:MAG: ATP-binding protein [Gammaproteobacteria bacterium]
MRVTIARSIRRKFIAIILATTLVALLVAAVALLLYDVRTYRQAWISDLMTQADIIGRSSAAALVFQDRDAARATLSLLAGRQSIQAAALYTADGELFASYSETARRESFPKAPSTQPWRIESGNLFIALPIIEDNQSLGVVYLRGRSQLSGRILDYLIILGAVMAASLLVAALLSTRLQAGVTGPILALTHAARKVVQTRDFSLHVPKTTDDEIGTLVDDFNVMLAEVGQRAAALEASNRSLQYETDERRAAETALRHADRRKDEFLATLAHELRNPLAPMVNALAILDSTGIDARLAQRAREMMGRQLSQMVRLVDDLLDVSRITTGRLVMRRHPVELAAVVRSAVDTARPLLEASQQELSLNLPSGPVHVHADATRLAQVFANLLNNAAKYTGPDGHISLDARIEDNGEELVVQVSDDGIGISAEKLPAVFEMFTQVDDSVERTQSGLGVGLSLARRLVELHGGSIEASSPGLGRGSTFIVRLPVLATAAPSVDDVRVQDPEAAPRYRILLVDDNVDYATSLGLLLSGLGHDVRLAHDAASALDTAGEFRPEFAFLDIGLPSVSGYELALRLRALPATAATVLVAVTGWGQEKDRRRAEEAGFDRHLVKPVELETIQSVLSSLAPGRADAFVEGAKGARA